MGDLSPLLLAACGLAVICAGLVFVGALMLMRVARGGRGGSLIGLITGATSNDDADANLLPQRRSRRMTSSDLQNKAEALDFDEALQKYRQTPGAQSAPPNPSLRGTGTSALRITPTTPPLQSSDREDPLDDFDARGFNLRNTNNQSLRRSRRGNEDSGDELIGGFLDGD